ncbi:hypothetical protein [Streptomyces sp. NPDC048106]|uniref:hypothetical protein n=1 Tax=Streptomyces sp. NPDC048106 TaxID=3155750 RepID=UPI003453EF30
MGIGKTAALLAAATGTVMFGAGGAEAYGGGGGTSGAQINNCKSVSMINIIGGPRVNCLNVDGKSGKHHGPQVNNCSAVLSVVGNTIFFPIEDTQGPSVNCANFRY